MSVLALLIVLICLVGLILATILFAPFIISSRLTRMEECQAERRTEELQAFLAKLKMEEENEILSAGKHREQNLELLEQVAADLQNRSFQPTSDELEKLFGDPSELANLAQLVEDIRNQPPRENNNYDHREYRDYRD